MWVLDVGFVYDLRQRPLRPSGPISLPAGRQVIKEKGNNDIKGNKGETLFSPFSLEAFIAQ